MSGDVERLETDGALLSAFVGPRYHIYARNWRRMDQHGARLWWNWAPFIFQVGWLGYRRMYGLAFLLIAIDAGETCLESLLGLPEWTGLLFNLVLFATLAVNADAWYRDFAQRETAAVAAAAPADPDAEAARRGAPSLAMGFIFFALMIAGLFAGDALAKLPALLAYAR